MSTEEGKIHFENIFMRKRTFCGKDKDKMKMTDDVNKITCSRCAQTASEYKSEIEYEKEYAR